MAEPIKSPGERFRPWNMAEIYTGPTGTGRYVPNVDDLGLSWKDLSFYRCIQVDYNTGYSTWQRVNLNNSTGVDETVDVITGVGSGYTYESFRVWINTKQLPYTMHFDARLYLYGTKSAYVKVFQGNDLSGNGRVISAMYNNSGVMTSENIPLELVKYSGDVTNLAVKTPVNGYCSTTINDGEILTAVVYARDGSILSACRLIAANSDAVRSLEASAKSISNIELISPYLSTNKADTLQYPLNMLVQSDSLKGRVRYSDGTSKVYAVDGVKFELQGIDSYIASEVGQEFPLILKYTLSNGEYAYGVSDPVPERSMSRDYKLETIKSDDEYSVKLFVVPEWLNTGKWGLRYYLYNLERDSVHDVTNLVELGSESKTFNGGNYDSVQEMTVVFNMLNLGTSYNYYRQVQKFRVQLYRPATDLTATTYYTIGYTTDLKYGSGIKARASGTTNSYILDISNGHQDVATWLEYMYSSVSPLRYTQTEAVAPVPTHVRLRIGSSWSREVPIENIFNKITNISTTVAQGTLLRLEFFKRTGDVDYELAISSMNITF